MFCFTVSCLHIKFSIWNNKMTELTFGGNVGALWLCLLYRNYIDKHHCLTILEIAEDLIITNLMNGFMN